MGSPVTPASSSSSFMPALQHHHQQGNGIDLDLNLDLDIGGVDVDPSRHIPGGGIGSAGSMPQEPVWLDLGDANTHSRMNSNPEFTVGESQGMHGREYSERAGLDAGGLNQRTQLLKDGQGRNDPQSVINSHSQSHVGLVNYPSIDLHMC
ncbi:hypothetical protein B0H34DRAFT_718554 [Crassisporium funariophilum]|nr:hypothetical protein B0H34DRAFT_718554 [Crassisporium funariophilum]